MIVANGGQNFFPLDTQVLYHWKGLFVLFSKLKIDWKYFYYWQSYDRFKIVYWIEKSVKYCIAWH